MRFEGPGATERRAIILARFYVACAHGDKPPSQGALAREIGVSQAQVGRDITAMVSGAEMICQARGRARRYMVCGKWSAWTAKMAAGEGS